jgi:hypothetical protein
MIGLLRFVVAVLASPFKSKIRLEPENAELRHQLVVLRRKVKGRVRLTNNDPCFVQLYRWFPSILPALMIIRPVTLVRWHRAGRENLLWGCAAHPRRLLKLRFELAQSSVVNYELIGLCKRVRRSLVGFGDPAP